MNPTYINAATSAVKAFAALRPVPSSRPIQSRSTGATTTTYLISLNNAAPATLEALGIVAATLTYRANAIDTLTLATVDSYTTLAHFDANDTVALIRRVTIDATSTDTCEFVGTIRAIPRAASDQEQSITYTAENAVKALQRCTYAQDWIINNGTIGVTVTEPRVILGENSSGTRLKSGKMIGAILNYAASRSINLQVGTIADGSYIPYDERENIKCWDGIVAMLRYTPDHVLTLDYTTQIDGAYVPTFNLLAPADMPAITEALPADATDTTITPRYDIQVPGLSIIFRYSGDVDGQPVNRRSGQTAGNTSHPESLALVYDLDGQHITNLKQTIAVEEWPTDLTDAAAKPFIAARIPWLTQEGVEYTVDSYSTDGVENYPAVLVSGSISPWMHVNQERETVTLTVSYKITHSGKVWDEGKKELYFTELSTDGTSKEYTKQASYLAAEPVPSNMAVDLYTSWHRLHYDGDLTLQYDQLPFHLKPGCTLNLTGGLPEWASMNAIVQSAAYNLADNTLALTFGSCATLEADDLMAIYRAARGRRYAVNRLSRSTDQSIDNNIEGITGTPLDSVADGTPANARSRFRIEAKDSSDNSVAIDINPAAIAYATPADKAAQTLQLRERVISYVNATGDVESKLAQLLCTDGYGAVLPLTGLPSGAAANQVLGTDAAKKPIWRDTITISMEVI